MFGSCIALGRNLALYVRLCIYSAVIEWDLEKAAENLEKHDIDFADAATVLSDEMALTIRDDHPTAERHVTLGMDALGRILVVAYTWREDRVRIISARRANRSEQRRYEGKR